MRLTQEELAARIGVSKSAVAKWETDGGLPDRDNLKKLSEVINVPLEQLYRTMEREGAIDIDIKPNITPDVIAILESYGYKVIRPDESNKENE
ncbi:MAG: helix-turn-helix transcriptional regulator [Lachnospiraceae bacterium]|nr:helix-turn-helix transcriptional regulator [Lachnospiraceae bacterium]